MSSTQISIILEDEVLEKIDTIRKEFHMSRAKFLTLTFKKYYQSLNQADDGGQTTQ